MPRKTTLSQVRLGQIYIKSKIEVKKSKILDKKIQLTRPGIKPGPPEDTETIRYLSLKIKTKNPGNFVTPTADKNKMKIQR